MGDGKEDVDVDDVEEEKVGGHLDPPVGLDTVVHHHIPVLTGEDLGHEHEHEHEHEHTINEI